MYSLTLKFHKVVHQHYLKKDGRFKSNFLCGSVSNAVVKELLNLARIYPHVVKIKLAGFMAHGVDASLNGRLLYHTDTHTHTHTHTTLFTKLVVQNRETTNT